MDALDGALQLAAIIIVQVLGRDPRRSLPVDSGGPFMFPLPSNGGV